MNRLPFVGIFALAAVFIGCSGSSVIERILEERRANAEQGDAEAQYQLGNAYNTGTFVPEDDAVAMKWYRRAADQGHAEAQNMVGMLYFMGDNVPKDHVEAVVWLSVAAFNGAGDNNHILDYLKTSLTPEKLSQAQQRATWLFEKIQSGKGQ